VFFRTAAIGRSQSKQSFKDFIANFEKIEALSNFQIIALCKKLKIKQFKGVFMRDELNTSTDNECLILNTDHSSGNGIHWTCLFIKNGIAYYFDSYGNEPLEEVKVYCNLRRPARRYYSTDRIQQNDHTPGLCGYYCVYMLWRLSNACGVYKCFYDVLDELYRCHI
jgi:hypothetical protein